MKLMDKVIKIPEQVIPAREERERVVHISKSEYEELKRMLLEEYGKIVLIGKVDDVEIWNVVFNCVPIIKGKMQNEIKGITYEINID